MSTNRYVLPDGRITLAGVAVMYGIDRATARSMFGEPPYTLGPPPAGRAELASVWESRRKAAQKALGNDDLESVLAYLAANS